MYTITDRTNFIEVSLDSQVLRALPKKKTECVAEGDYVIIRERGQDDSSPITFKIKYDECSSPSESSAIDLKDAINVILNA